MKNKSKQVRIFYAYPDQPPDVGETISKAIRKLKTEPAVSQGNVRFKPWPETPVSGKNLITAILEQLDRHHIFACDLTHPSPNVNFELGYAIARSKRIFTALNPTIRNAAKDYSRLYYTLLSMGYTSYENHEQLADAILEEKPWQSLNQTLLNEHFRQRPPRFENPTLLYVKPSMNSDSVISTQEQLRNSIFKDSLVIDDPNEYSAQMVEWYADKLMTADAVVVHLLSTAHSGHNAHNLKASLIAGLAKGFDLPLLMLAHAPYKPPVDYAQWLYVHKTAANCVTGLSKWLDELNVSLAHRRGRRRKLFVSGSKPKDLRSLFLGDPVAEHEAENLHEYFVETSAFYHAVDQPLTILVGRRGTGKTAILYAAQSELISERDNHVTILKPIGYETHGLIRVLEEVKQRSERGFLIESIWKYLIYSEIANSVATEIKGRTIYQPKTEEEEAFLNYCETNSDILSPPFSERIENAVSALYGVGAIKDSVMQRAKISELLHNSLIGDLRNLVGEVLGDRITLSLLIDGLDEPWGPGEHVSHLAELIGGLLTVAQYIPRDFQRSTSKIKPVNTKVTILLRSDIFAFIQHLIPEQDKLPIVRVTWNDRELLLRVLEERMLYGTPKGYTAQHIWDELFPAEIVGVPSTDFILRTVLPRPRDLIHVTKAAVSNAINRGHNKIQEDDFLSARNQYSQYAFDSILKEDDPSKGKLEEVLYQFAGVGKILTKSDIEHRCHSAGVAISDIEFYLDLLCDISFLAIDSKTGFQFPKDEEERRTLRNVASTLAAQDGREEKFQINDTFYQVLQIE